VKTDAHVRDEVDLGGVNVATDAGKVCLVGSLGSVGSRNRREETGRAASSAPGVTCVVNDLFVVS